MPGWPVTSGLQSHDATIALSTSAVSVVAGWAAMRSRSGSIFAYMRSAAASASTSERSPATWNAARYSFIAAMKARPSSEG